MKISVITAVYNAKDTIVDAIESTLNQSYPNVETIIIDGGSTDGTKEILEKYRNSFSLFISEPDDGIYDALNKGIKYATGDVVGFLHADDLYENKRVLSCVAEAFSVPEIDGVYGDLVYVNKNEPDKVIRYWKSGNYSRSKLKHGWMPPHPTFYVRKSVFDQLGLYDTSFKISADYDAMLRFLQSGIRCEYIPRVLVKMRVGGMSNRSFKNIITKMNEDYKAIRNNNVGGVGTLVLKNVSKIQQFIT